MRKGNRGTRIGNCVEYFFNHDFSKIFSTCGYAVDGRFDPAVNLNLIKTMKDSELAIEAESREEKELTEIEDLTDIAIDDESDG